VETDDEGALVCYLDDTANGRFTEYDADWGKFAATLNKIFSGALDEWYGFSKTYILGYGDSTKMEEDGENTIITSKAKNITVSAVLDADMKINKMQFDIPGRVYKAEVLPYWETTDEGFLVSEINMNSLINGKTVDMDEILEYDTQKNFKMPEAITIKSKLLKMNLVFKFHDYLVWTK
jgi:hypothetical protein